MFGGQFVRCQIYKNEKRSEVRYSYPHPLRIAFCGLCFPIHISVSGRAVSPYSGSSFTGSDQQQYVDYIAADYLVADGVAAPSEQVAQVAWAL